MNSKDDHLSPEEISTMLDLHEDTALAADRQRHAQSCEHCRLVLSQYREAQEELRGLAVREPAQRSPQCPPDEVWLSVACGMLPPLQEQTLLEHAAFCDFCGAMLAAVSNDVALETSPQEAEQMRSLRTSSPAWQRNIAREMSKAAHPARPSILSNWLARAAAVIIALGSAGGGYFFWAARQPAQLLAAAYTEQRPFEYRIPDAGHAPVRVEKSGGSSFNRPADLLRAEASIAEALRRRPESVEWLALRARAEMLGWDAEAAIATLQLALPQKPGDSSLEAALGMAYALRAEKASRATDYGQAVEHLGRALRKDPANRDASFNRALVLERMFLLEEAVKEWNRYLKLDPSGPWAGEARLRLQDTERRIKARRDALGRFSNHPQNLLRLMDSGENIKVESDLDLVVADWLPKRWENAASGRALEALGARQNSRHQHPSHPLDHILA